MKKSLRASIHHLSVFTVFGILLILGCKKGENPITGESIYKMSASINGSQLTATNVTQSLVNKQLTLTGEFANKQVITISIQPFDSTAASIGNYTIGATSGVKAIGAYNTGVQNAADNIAQSGTITVSYNNSKNDIVQGAFDFTTQNNYHITNGTYQSLNY